MIETILIPFVIAFVLTLYLFALLYFKNVQKKNDVLLDILKRNQSKIITRLPNRIMIEEGVGEKLYWAEMIGFKPYPVTSSEIIFKPTQTNIYDLIDYKDELYDNIVRLQRVQPKDLKENHRYYRVTHVSMLEERTEYFYIGEPLKETKPKAPRTKKETKIEKEENDKNE